MSLSLRMMPLDKKMLRLAELACDIWTAEWDDIQLQNLLKSHIKQMENAQKAVLSGCTIEDYPSVEELRALQRSLLESSRRVREIRTEMTELQSHLTERHV